MYFRINVTQEVIAELLFVDQSTITRAISDLEEIIAEALDEFVPDLLDEIEGRVGVIDGSLYPCWSWVNASELCSSKRKTTGRVHQFVCDLSGNLMHISDPLPGNTHDAKAIHRTGLSELLGDDNDIGNKGYIGTGITTPYRKSAGGELLGWQKEFNTPLFQTMFRVSLTVFLLSGRFRRHCTVVAITMAAASRITSLRMYWPSKVGMWWGPVNIHPVSSTIGDKMLTSQPAISEMDMRSHRPVISNRPMVHSSVAINAIATLLGTTAGTNPKLSRNTLEIAAIVWSQRSLVCNQFSALAGALTDHVSGTCGACEWERAIGRIPTHRGMFPCFLGGRVWRLSWSMLRARVMWGRVWEGGITAST